MSKSTPSGRKTSPYDRDAESSRIESANKTSAAFIGGHQPTWMSDPGASQSKKCSAGINKKKQVSNPLPSQRPPKAIINASVPVKQSQTRDSQQSQQSTHVAETSSTTNNIKQASSTSPSPAPTPVNSGQATTESSRVESSTSFSSPPSASSVESRNPRIGEAAQQLPTQDACASDSNVASNNSTIKTHHHNQSLPHRNSGSSHPPAISPMGSPLPQQVPQQIAFRGFIYQLKHPAPSPSLNNPELHTIAAASVTTGTPPGRLSRHPQVQLDMSKILQDNVAVWHQRLIEYINHATNFNRNFTVPETQRCNALINACQVNDVFFLVLHQFYCLWSIDPGYLRSILPPTSHGYLCPSFESLATILKPNTDIQQPQLSWFACYPYAADAPAQTYPSFQMASNQVVRFLVSLARNWSKCLASVRNRRYPVMVQELKQNFHCHSQAVQMLMFTCSWRFLGPGNRLLAAEFSNAFQADWHNETQAEKNPKLQQVHQARENIRHSYIAIANYMISQANITMVAASFTNSVTSVNQNYSRPVAPVISTASAVSLAPHDACNPRTQFVQDLSPSTPWQSQSPPSDLIPQMSANSSTALVHQRPCEAGCVPSQTPTPQQQRFVQSANMKANNHQGSLPRSLVLPSDSQIDKNRRYSHERQAHKKLVANVHTGMARGQDDTPVSGFSTAPLGEVKYPQSQHDWTSVKSDLHLGRAHGPRRASDGGSRTQYYQYLHRFAVNPTVLVRQNGAIQTFDFAVTSTEFADCSHLVHAEATKVHQHQQGALRYRLRLSGQLPEDKTSCIADWASTPCVWPPEVYIKFNDQTMFPPRPPHCHQDRPIELTHIIRQGFNTVKISLPDHPENYKKSPVYHLAVEIVRTLDHESTLAIVMDTEAFSAEQTEKEIEKRLTMDDNSLRISFIDSLSSSMVKWPVRGLRCKHIECFDLEIWLKTRHGKPSENRAESALADEWKCPICKEYAGPLSLRIDAYFVKVRKALIEAGKEPTESIKVSKGGNMAVIEELKDDENDSEKKEKDCSVAPSQKKMPEPEVIEISDD